MTRLITSNLTFFQPTSLFRELILLDEIAQNKNITQSILAERAGIVPAMVNNYIKGFVKRGYLQVRGNNRDMTYTVTLSGETYRAELLATYFRETVGLYKNVKREIQNKLQMFKDEGIGSIILYGAAETAEITINAAEDLAFRVVGIVDGDQDKQGKEFYGKRIERPELIASCRPDGVIISSSGHQEQIYESIKQYESEGIKIRKL